MQIICLVVAVMTGAVGVLCLISIIRSFSVKVFVLMVLNGSFSYLLLLAHKVLNL